MLTERLQCRMRTRLLLISSAALLAIAGCSSASPEPSPSPTPTPTASPSATAVLPPIMIDGKEQAVEAAVGATLTVSIAGVTEISTDNAQVLEVKQPREYAGGATEYGGARVLAPGTAKLNIQSGSGPVVVTVTATG